MSGVVGNASDSQQTVLRSVERSAQDARPLIAWTSSQIERLKSSVEDALRQWQTDWGVISAGGLGREQVATSAVSCVEVSEIFNDVKVIEWIGSLTSASLGRSWVGIESLCSSDTHRSGSGTKTMIASLCRAMFDGPPTNLITSESVTAAARPPLAAELAQAAWDAWWARLAECLGDVDTSCDKVHFEFSDRSPALRPWSGALGVRLNWYGHILCFVLGEAAATRFLHVQTLPSASAVRQTVKRTTPHGVVPVFEALSHHTIRLSVQLQPAELALRTLTTLRIGDVVRIPHLLETPLLVKTSDGKLLCEGFLGKIENLRAVELALPGKNGGS